MSQRISQLPAGSKVIESNTKYYNAVIPWIVLEHGHDGASNTTLLAEKILTLKCFDAKEPNNSNSDRRNYGNNRYSVSNIRQWLNSDAAAGGWYSAQHSADQTPSTSYVSCNAYDTQAGFLNGFSADFKALLQNVTKIVAKNTVTDGGGSETVTNKIFLLSETEVGLGNENNIAEGTQYTYFNSADRRKCKCTAEAIANSNYGSNPTVNDNWYWWLRTPYASGAYYARSVDDDGTLNYHAAYYGYRGVRPACSIPSDTKVSDGPNQDGYYEIVYNQSPEISPAGSSLGELNAPLQQTYSITDADGDAFTGTVTLDNTQIRTFSGTASSTLSLDLASEWSGLSNTSHTLVISVTDSESNNTTETYTFTKTNAAVVISPVSKSYSTLTSPFNDTFTISDSDGDAFTGTVTLDSTQIQSISGTSSTTITVNLTSQWPSLAEGSHTLTISVTDANNVTTTETYTFSKLIPHPGVIDESVLTNIANAIRSKTGGSSLITLNNMASAISGIVIGDEIHGAITLSDFNNMTDADLLALNEGDNVIGDSINVSQTATRVITSGDKEYTFTLNYSHTNSCKINKEDTTLYLVPWSTGTDEQIVAMVQAYYDGVFTLADIQTVWHVGDSRTISLNAMAATGVGESHRAQNVDVVILDFDHDTLTTPISSKTKALVSVEMKDCLRDASVSDTGHYSNTERGYMNSSNTNVGGWNSSARRTWCNNVFYNALPSAHKALVKQVNKLTSAGNKSSTINTTADYVWLPSEIEIFGSTHYSFAGEGTQYSYYTTTNNRNKLPRTSEVSGVWWERSPFKTYELYFCYVNGGGNASGDGASSPNGLSPAWAL